MAKVTEIKLIQSHIVNLLQGYINYSEEEDKKAAVLDMLEEAKEEFSTPNMKDVISKAIDEMVKELMQDTKQKDEKSSPEKDKKAVIAAFLSHSTARLSIEFEGKKDEDTKGVYLKIDDKIFAENFKYMTVDEFRVKIIDFLPRIVSLEILND